MTPYQITFHKRLILRNPEGELQFSHHSGKLHAGVPLFTIALVWVSSCYFTTAHLLAGFPQLAHDLSPEAVDLLFT